MIISKYFTPIEKITTVDEARQIAVEYQTKTSQIPMSYGDIAEYQQYFEKLGKKFNLLDEFRENGII